LDTKANMQEMQVHIDTKCSQDVNQQVNMADLDNKLKGSTANGTSLNKYINHNVSAIESHNYEPILNNAQGRQSVDLIAPVTEVTA